MFQINDSNHEVLFLVEQYDDKLQWRCISYRFAAALTYPQYKNADGTLSEGLTYDGKFIVGTKSLNINNSFAAAFCAAVEVSQGDPEFVRTCERNEALRYVEKYGWEIESLLQKYFFC